MLYNVAADGTLTITAGIPELWVKAIQHFAEQQEKSINFEGTCVYKNDTLSCAVGFINPDWFHGHEYTTVYRLVSKGYLNLERRTESFLEAMQDAHDTARNILEFYDKLYDVAETYNLDTASIHTIKRWKTDGNHHLKLPRHRLSEQELSDLAALSVYAYSRIFESVAVELGEWGVDIPSMFEGRVPPMTYMNNVDALMKELGKPRLAMQNLAFVREVAALST